MFVIRLKPKELDGRGPCYVCGIHNRRCTNKLFYYAHYLDHAIKWKSRSGANKGLNDLKKGTVCPNSASEKIDVDSVDILEIWEEGDS